MKTFLSPLTMEQESECLKKMKNGDLEARNELIERNMRLVAHVAKKYQSQEDEMEDLISIGTIGLIKGIVYYHKPLRTLWEKDNDTEGDRKKTWDFQILCFEDRKEGDRKTQAGILGVL